MPVANPEFIGLHLALRNSIPEDSKFGTVCFASSTLLSSVSPKHLIDIPSIGADAIDPELAYYAVNGRPIVTSNPRSEYTEAWLRFYALREGSPCTAEPDHKNPAPPDNYRRHPDHEYTLVSPIESPPYIIQYNKLGRRLTNEENCHFISSDEARNLGIIILSLTP